MMLSSKWRHLLWLMVLTSCKGPQRDHAIKLVNRLDKTITDVHVLYPDGFVSVGGIMTPSGEGGKTHAGIRSQVPEKATVIWREQAGEQKRVDVEIRKHLPDGCINGTIVFTINPDESVSVSYEPRLRF